MPSLYLPGMIPGLRRLRHISCEPYVITAPTSPKSLIAIKNNHTVWTV